MANVEFADQLRFAQDFLQHLFDPLALLHDRADRTDRHIQGVFFTSTSLDGHHDKHEAVLLWGKKLEALLRCRDGDQPSTFIVSRAFSGYTLFHQLGLKPLRKLLALG